MEVISHFGRQWKYNASIPEFFVEDETTTKVKLTDIHRETESTQLEAPRL